MLFSCIVPYQTLIPFNGLQAGHCALLDDVSAVRLRELDVYGVAESGVDKSTAGLEERYCAVIDCPLRESRHQL